MNIDFDPAMLNGIELLKKEVPWRPRASLDAPDWSWHSARPQLHMYDDEMINALLKVAKTHLSSTFALFADFQATHVTRVELCLAMAAVGALYCTIPDSNRVAKMLYNDARRILLEQYIQHTDTSFEQSLSFAQTFVLLELWGFCSGDKRAFEFIEVFHGSKLHTITCCMDTLPRVESQLREHGRLRLLMEAANILNSYRVLLLQLPPSFLMEIISRRRPNRGQHTLSADGILPPSSGGLTDRPPTGGIHQLTETIRFTWMVRSWDADGASKPLLWKKEFVELELHRWLRANTAHPDPACKNAPTQMLLFHLAQIILHADVHTLHRQALTAAQHASGSKQGIAHGAKARKIIENRLFTVALWHARAILHLAQTIMSAAQDHPKRLVDVHAVPTQPPHLPFCIYFATLIVWFHDIRHARDEQRTADDTIRSSSKLLLTLKASVSEALNSILTELLWTYSA